MLGGAERNWTYSEMSSNWISVPSASEAMPASSSPVQGLGLIGGSAEKYHTAACVRGYHACEDHQWSTVLVVKAMLALSREDTRCHLSQILKQKRSV